MDSHGTIPPTVEPLDLRATDGVDLRADVAVPSGRRVGGAIVCHPHPQYGGDRHNPVVQALFDALPGLGLTTVRFDFRDDFDHGRGEVLDAVAAIDAVADLGEGPIVACGYSFGAIVTLAADHPAITHRVLVAPPLGAIDFGSGRTVPTLVVTPEHDQFCPPATARSAIEGWSDTSFVEVPSADHFLFGAVGSVSDQVVSWLRPQLPSPPSPRR